MEKYQRQEIQFFLHDGSRISGYMDIFTGSRMTDMVNAKYDRELFLTVYEAKIVLANSRIFNMPWILVNRHTISNVKN